MIFFCQEVGVCLQNWEKDIIIFYEFAMDYFVKKCNTYEGLYKYFV